MLIVPIKMMIGEAIGEVLDATTGNEVRLLLKTPDLPQQRLLIVITSNAEIAINRTIEVLIGLETVTTMDEEIVAEEIVVDMIDAEDATTIDMIEEIAVATETDTKNSHDEIPKNHLLLTCSSPRDAPWKKMSSRHQPRNTLTTSSRCPHRRQR
jgi:hypothetical protein